MGDMVLEECLAKGSGDNMSIIVVAMEQAPRPLEPPLYVKCTQKGSDCDK